METKADDAPRRDDPCEKRRPVSRATLFSGSGPDTGGVISAWR